MDEAARVGRREQARRRVRRQRWLVAVGAGGLVLAVLVGGALMAAGPEDDGPTLSERAELPRGGREILPANRVVAFYGAPRDPELGTLGIGSPDRVARRLERQASQYEGHGRPVLPAFELITTLVTQEAGEEGNHALHEETSTVRSYLRAARAHEMLLILDIQPGYASFLDEAQRLEPLLRQPEVSLALDPEWSMDPPQLPGQEIGSTDAETINAVSRYLSDLVRRHDLPQKLLVVHRFTEEMVESEEQLERHPGVALVVNVDGFGDQPNKIAKYGQLARKRRSSFNGFKLFYEEDIDLMKPEQVMRLRPQPVLVVYE
jgi:hypothetical protein